MPLQRPFHALGSWRMHTAHFSPVLSICQHARCRRDSPLCANLGRPAWWVGPSQCTCPGRRPLARDTHCSPAQWQASHKTATRIKGRACGYTLQGPRSVTRVLNNLLLVLQKEWKAHYWVTRTHFIRKVSTMRISRVAFKRVARSSRRARKTGSHGVSWETSGSLSVQAVLPHAKVRCMEMKRRGSEKDRRRCHSTLTLVMFTCNFKLFFVFLWQHENLVDHLTVEFQLYVEFLSRDPGSVTFLRVGHSQLALSLPTPVKAWLRNTAASRYACIFKLWTFIIQY